MPDLTATASPPPAVRGVGMVLATAWGRARDLGVARALSWGSLVATALVAAWQRADFILAKHPPQDFLWSDMNGYAERAWNLANPAASLSRFDTFYPPGTHVLMAPLTWLAGSRERGMAWNQYLWLVLAVVCLWAVGALGLKLFRHPLAGTLAMGALLLYPPFTSYTGFYMSENPFSCFMALALLVGLVANDMDPDRPWRRAAVYAVAGLLAGVATTIRPQFTLGAGLMGLPLLRRRFPFVHVREGATLFIAWLVPCAAAMALNAHAAGTWVGLSGNAGFNFYQGHCDVVTVEAHHPDHELYYVFSAPVRLQRAANEGWPEKKTVIQGHMAWESGYFFREGLTCILADGWRHARRFYQNQEDFFAGSEPWPPNTGAYAHASSWANRAYSHGLLFLLPVALFLARYRRPERWLLLQLATVLPVGLIFYGDSRYRIPYDMFGFLLLVGVVVSVLGLRRDPRWIPGVGWRRGIQTPGPTSGPP